MLIAVDNGNKTTKSKHSAFISGVMESSTKPGLGSDILYYKNKYYVLAAKRKAYLRNKTTDEDTFILTLFAIAKELEACGVRAGKQTTVPVELCVGLPPAHYGTMYKAFEQYFANRGPIEFALDGKEYRILINQVCVYVQALGAYMTVFSKVRDSDCVVVDIGGFTCDLLPCKNGKPAVAECDSLEIGVSKLYGNIVKKVNSEFDLLLDEDKIDAVLQNKQSELPYNVKQLIRQQAENFVDNLVSALRERDIDLRTTKAVFCGGGSVLLEEYLRSNPRVGTSAIVITDISANAKGYEILYKMAHPAT